MAWLPFDIPFFSKPATATATTAPAVAAVPTSTPTPATDAAAASKPKPCCVCKDEKSRRDECMLFSKAPDPSSDCQSTIDQYRSCMAAFGYQV